MSMGVHGVDTLPLTPSALPLTRRRAVHIVCGRSFVKCAGRSKATEISYDQISYDQIPNGEAFDGMQP
jgi:hypothetical protein